MKKWWRIIGSFAFLVVFFTALSVAVITQLLHSRFYDSPWFFIGWYRIAARCHEHRGYYEICNEFLSPLAAILEGESLLNDASSLIIFRFALVAVECRTNHLAGSCTELFMDGSWRSRYQFDIGLDFCSARHASHQLTHPATDSPPSPAPSPSKSPSSSPSSQLVLAHTVTLFRGLLSLRVPRFPLLYISAVTLLTLTPPHLGLLLPRRLRLPHELDLPPLLQAYLPRPRHLPARHTPRRRQRDLCPLRVLPTGPPTPPSAALSAQIFDVLVALRLCTPPSAADILSRPRRQQLRAARRAGERARRGGAETRPGARAPRSAAARGDGRVGGARAEHSGAAVGQAAGAVGDGADGADAAAGREPGDDAGGEVAGAGQEYQSETGEERS